MTTTREAIPPDVLRPSAAEVLHSQGIARPGVAPRRILDLAEQALQRLEARAAPQAQWRPVDAPTFEAVYTGQGHNAPGPVPAIARQARQRVLFVATLGPDVDAAIASLFAEHDFALASFLDGAASAMAERAAGWLEARLQDDPASARDPADLVRAYSPGYCGWHLSGQAALLAALDPAAIGVHLEPSCLMTPLKSISGVLLGASPAVHRIEPRYPCCQDCRGRPCLARQRARDVGAAPGDRSPP